MKRHVLAFAAALVCTLSYVTPVNAAEERKHSEICFTERIQLFPEERFTCYPFTVSNFENCYGYDMDIKPGTDFIINSIDILEEKGTVIQEEDVWHVSIRSDTEMKEGCPLSLTCTNKVTTVDKDNTNYALIAAFSDFAFYGKDGTRFYPSYTIRGNLSAVIVDCKYESDDLFGYNFYQDHAEIIYVQEGISAVEIPAEYRSRPVTDARISWGSDLKEITVKESSAYLSGKDGVLFNKEQTELMVIPSAFPAESYTIPTTVKKIGEEVLTYPKQLKRIIIPATVTEISETAFSEIDHTDFTICGHAGTAAERYACQYYFSFQDLDTGVITPRTISGALSKTMTWKLDENGVMTISGSGEMPYFEHSQVLADAETPWHDLNDCITELIVADGVTSISNDAFALCSNLKHVQLPDSIRKLDYEAFYECTALKDLQLPPHITSFGELALAGVPFETVTISAETAEIGQNAFRTCSYAEVVPENPYFCSENGIILDKEKTKIITIPGRMKNVVIPEGIRAFPDELSVWGCEHETISLPASFEAATDIKWKLSSSKTLREITVSPDSTVYSSYKGVLYTKDMQEIVAVPKGMTTLYVPAVSEELNLSELMRQSDSIHRVVVPESVKILTVDRPGFAPIPKTMDIYYAGQEGSLELKGEFPEQIKIFYGAVQPEVLPGDVNEDDAINAKDANAILIAAAKIGTGNPSGLMPELETAADVNSDGAINAKDANIVLRYAAAVGIGMRVSITDFV